VKIDGALMVQNPADAADAARGLEASGYDGGYTFEGPHDPFLPLAVAAGATQRLELATAIAIGFARNPMLLANLGYDLQLLSNGRFILGLGSQIRPHIQKRFGMPWSRPAARMRDLVLAIRAIWRSWHDGETLDYRGEFYTHTLMTPIFNPGPNPHGLPPIFVAGVGPRMTEVVGEVADGYFVHPFHTQAFLRETTTPALTRGLATAGRLREDFQVACQVIVAIGETEEELARSKNAARAHISFYGSTPAYRPVLESIGRGAVQDDLNALSKRGEWLEMAGRIDDEILEQVAVVGRPSEVADQVRARYAGFADRIAMISQTALEPECWSDVVRALRDD